MLHPGQSILILFRLTPEELHQRLARGDALRIVDVREPHEWDIVHLEGATLIPLGKLPQEVHRLSSAEDIVLHCRSGTRSAEATRFLLDAGFTRVHNLQGGILAWAERVDPSLPKY